MLITPRGAVASGDTRETYSRYIHIDLRRKVFKSKDEKSLLALTGITTWKCVDYFKRISKFCIDPDNALTQKLEYICTQANEATLRKYTDTHEDSVLDAFITQKNNNEWVTFEIHSLNGNGRPKQRVSKSKIIIFESGLGTENIPRITQTDINDLSFSELLDFSNNKCREAIEATAARARADRTYTNTVGGKILQVSIKGSD